LEAIDAWRAEQEGKIGRSEGLAVRNRAPFIYFDGVRPTAAIGSGLWIIGHAASFPEMFGIWFAPTAQAEGELL
jgi:hypothetical protein